MKKDLHNLLESWPFPFIQDQAIGMALQKTDNARYAAVKRAMKAGQLLRVRRGLYLIASKIRSCAPDKYALAAVIYQPSAVSLESALSYHGWIPEAVYTTTCVSPKRAQDFKTPLGVFSYKHVPPQGFYDGIVRHETALGITMVATPWRALADLMFTRHISWPSLSALLDDMRIDEQPVIASDDLVLAHLAERYPSIRVRKALQSILGDVRKKRRRN